MKPSKLNSQIVPFGMVRLLAAALSISLLAGQTFLLAVQAQGPRRQTNSKQRKARLSDDRRVAHVLSRLTFGARPGDVERVKAMGVDAFVAEQLDADAIPDTALAAKLKLPTLGLAQTVLIEQYTPPKPAASPSPSPTPQPSPKPDVSPSPERKSVVVAALNANEKGETAAAFEKAEPKAMSADQATAAEQKPGGEMKMPERVQSPSNKSGDAKPPAPKPTPPPKTPQLVVSELQRATLLRAVYSERQLYELMIGFWENHFSIFANKDADRLLLTSFDRDTIRPFAMGRFRDLLGATAHSPAMLFYLDNWQSSVPRPYPAKNGKPAGVDGGINENYARELMELHSLGVDGGYTQKDVQEVARCFTGWTIQKPDQEGLFLYRPGLHDNGEKIVLGHKILPGGGIADGERVLDILAAQPATARFIATKLARRFIADDPPESVIARAAAVFLKTDGSIRETLRAIITSPEFWSPAAYRAKLRSPLEYVAAAIRAANAETDADNTVLGAIARMGQPVFGRITPDGYADRADQWLSAGAMLERFNFANALAANRIKGTRIDPLSLIRGGETNDTRAIAESLVSQLLAGDVSQQTREAIDKIAADAGQKAVQPAPLTGVNYASGPGKPATNPYVVQLITMLIGSPEFQRR